MIKRIVTVLLGSALLVIPSIVTAKLKIVTVRSAPIARTLYFSGQISPIINVPVISPTQGVVDKKHFTYGEIVQKNQILMHIHSEKAVQAMRNAQVTYLNALADYEKKLHWRASNTMISAQNNYVKAKRILTQAENNLAENKKLYQLQIISRDALEQIENSYLDDKMAFEQASRQLKAVTQEGRGAQLTIARLKLSNATEKYQSLKAQVAAHNIKAPATGIVLEPEANSNQNNSNHQNIGKIIVGTTVTYQQVLLTIGDMNGLTINLQVPEININHIKKGQQALVTGSAFPKIHLVGKVTAVGAQALKNASGSVPTFPVVVTVSNLSTTARKQIRSGMDAQVAISIYHKKQAVQVPINAVARDKKGKRYVIVYDPINNKKTKQIVTTGKIDQANVEILSGLHVGEQVIIP